MTGTMSARTPSIKPATANLPLVAVPARALDQPMALNVTAAIPMVGYTIGIQNNSAAATARMSPARPYTLLVCGVAGALRGPRCGVWLTNMPSLGGELRDHLGSAA